MNRGLYTKLALQNIKNNKNTFAPFSLACIAMVAMTYILQCTNMQTASGDFRGATYLHLILNMGVWVCIIFSAFVILYTDGFLLKQRAKEFGLYSILGLEKRHVAKVVFWEMFFTGAFSIAAGIAAGLLLARLMFLLLLKILQLPTKIEFSVNLPAAGFVAEIYAVYFAVILLINAIRVFRMKPIDLLQSTKQGEKEPRANWLLALIGFALLGGGYYLALRAENPIAVLGQFFVAVLLVIGGTFLLFISGSVALLKLLKKNKNYYYHKRHFITVSGLMYRMRQNAMGLATICILSTAVLVVLSTTASLYVGMEGILRERYRLDVMAEFFYSPDRDGESESRGYDYDQLPEKLDAYAKKHHVSILDTEAYFMYSTLGGFEDGCFGEYNVTTSNAAILQAMTVEDYCRITGEEISLGVNEALVYYDGKVHARPDEITLFGERYAIVGQTSMNHMPTVWTSAYLGIYVIVDNIEALRRIRDAHDALRYSDGHSNVVFCYGYNLSGTLEDKVAFCEGVRTFYNDEAKLAHLSSCENIYTVREEVFQMYGGLFYIGLFIGALFLTITVMIIYYKQISEGYDDASRFEIMQKVGMSKEEVKQTIGSQISVVFFLPIAMAVIHICFAFKIICKLLAMLNLTDTVLFFWGTCGTIVAFFAVYAIVYRLTARVYYKLVYHH